jgi:phage shock protein PspC (stress-responsive transcriptional regulator)
VAYLLVWVIMPEGSENHPETTRPRLTRSVKDVQIAGVCGGLAEYFGVDATPIRVFWVVLSILPGVVIGGLLVYLASWILIPKAPTPALTVQPISST